MNEIKPYKRILRSFASRRELHHAVELAKLGRTEQRCSCRKIGGRVILERA